MSTHWKTVRVFISSTFLDMQAERDYLVRFVFPKLREELLKRLIHFVDIDLRWGVTYDQDALDVCREVIDESRPRFLCILGGRYGWVPPNKTRSITADEVHYGVLDRALKNRGFAYFYFRDEISNASIMETTPGEFREPNGSDKESKLFELKQAIISAGLNPYIYKAQWDNNSRRLIGLKEFGDRVYDDLFSSMESDPILHDHFVFVTDLAEPIDEFVEENAAMEAFVAERCERFVLGSRERVLNQLLIHAKSTNNNGYICLTGAPGSGKSALLAFLSQHPTLTTQPSAILIYHFVGASSGSTNGHRTLMRLCHELKRRCPSIATEIPSDPEELSITFQDILNQASEEQHVIILLDAINQFDRSSNFGKLKWLPERLPKKVRIIVSALESPELDELRLRRQKLFEIKLMPLTANDGETIIEQFLQRYNKRLEKSQRTLLLSKSDAGTPLYLLTALEELRTLGTFEEISRHIQELPQTIHGLFIWILERLGKDDGFRDSRGLQVGRELVSRFASILGASRYGLSQSEITDLLEANDPQGNVAALLHLLRPYLMNRGNLLDFYHSQFRFAAEEAWLKTEAERKAAHTELAIYFRKQVDPSGDSQWQGLAQRPYGELVHHYIEAGNLIGIRAIAESRFLDRATEILGDIEGLGIARKIAESIGAKDNEESSAGLIRCAEAYSLILARIRRSPFALMRMVKERQVYRTISMIKGETNPIRRILLEAAGSGLLSGIGEFEEARLLRDNAKAAFYAHQNNYNFEQNSLISALLNKNQTEYEDNLNPSQDKQENQEYMEDEPTSEHNPSRFIPMAHTIAVYLSNLGPVHRVVLTIYILTGFGFLIGFPFEITNWFQVVKPNPDIRLIIPRLPFAIGFTSIMVILWLGKRTCEQWLHKNGSKFTVIFERLKKRRFKIKTRNSLRITERALAFHNLLQGSKLGLGFDDHDRSMHPRWSNPPWLTTLSSTLTNGIASARYTKDVSRIIISAIDGKKYGDLLDAIALGIRKTDEKVRKSIILQITKCEDKEALFYVFTKSITNIREEETLRQLIELANLSKTAEPALNEYLHNLSDSILSSTLLATIEYPKHSGRDLNEVIKGILPIMIPSFRPLRNPLCLFEPIMWILLWFPAILLWSMIFGPILLLLILFILIFLRVLFTICGVYYDPLTIDSKNRSNTSLLDKINEIETIANPQLWTSLKVREKEERKNEEIGERLFLWSHIQQQRNRILTTTAAYKVLEEDLLLSGNAILYPHKILRHTLKALAVNRLLKWSNTVLLRWMGEKDIIEVLSRNKNLTHHTHHARLLKRSEHERQLRRIMPLPIAKSLPITAGLTFFITCWWLLFLYICFGLEILNDLSWKLAITCLILSIVLAVSQHTIVRLLGGLSAVPFALLIGIYPQARLLSVLAVLGTLVLTNLVVPWIITIGRGSNLIYPLYWKLWGQRLLLLGILILACLTIVFLWS